MPTSNPRVNVTLSPSLDNLLCRLAALQGVSKSSVLRELLETSEPALQRVVALMDAAAAAKPSMLRDLANSLDKAQSTLEGNLGEALRGFDGATADLVSQAEAVRGRRRGRAPVARERGGSLALQNPPASNRGVKSRETASSSPVPRQVRRGAK
jgi:hypothetical protein